MSLDEPALALGPNGRLVLASSGLDHYRCAQGVLPVRRLPNIHDPEFVDALLGLIDECGIDRVYCPVTSVYAAVGRIVSSRAPGVSMVGDSPHQRVLSRQHHVRLRAVALRLAARQLAGNETDVIDSVDATALLTLTTPVYGESNDSKFAGFAVAMRTAPQGDVVEVGALMGKSALALGFLAERFNVGPVLAVDPWRTEAAVQHDSPELIKQLAGAWDLDEVHQVFTENVAMLPKGRIVYRRATSVQAAQQYARGHESTGEAVGPLSGGVSLLHVDGNHDESHVRADCRAWFRFMRPGGWVVLDDYEWAHGTGPRVVGDEILRLCAADVQQSFKAGKALFLRLGDGVELKRWALESG